MILSLTTALTTLTLLGGTDAERIKWRHAGPGDSNRFVVTCNGRPVGPSSSSTPFQLVGGYAKYCSVDWHIIKGKLEQIYEAPHR